MIPMKTTDILQCTDPRMQGIDEQYKRACRFLKLARRCRKESNKFFNLIAAIYPARAVAELMLEAAEKGCLETLRDKDGEKARKEFEGNLAPKLPYYYLIEKIRIHDFHRFGCLMPNQKYRKVFIGGPIKLIANKGIATMTVSQKGVQVALTGNSSVKQYRLLVNADGQFHDEETGNYLPLEEILGEYLGAIPEAIEYFKIKKSS
jgi:hypothetical protein